MELLDVVVGLGFVATVRGGLGGGSGGLGVMGPLALLVVGDILNHVVVNILIIDNQIDIVIDLYIDFLELLLVCSPTLAGPSSLPLRLAATRAGGSLDLSSP